MKKKREKKIRYELQLSLIELTIIFKSQANNDTFFGLFKVKSKLCS